MFDIKTVTYKSEMAKSVRTIFLLAKFWFVKERNKITVLANYLIVMDR